MLLSIAKCTHFTLPNDQSHIPFNDMKTMGKTNLKIFRISFVTEVSTILLLCTKTAYYRKKMDMNDNSHDEKGKNNQCFSIASPILKNKFLFFRMK